MAGARGRRRAAQFDRVDLKAACRAARTSRQYGRAVVGAHPRSQRLHDFAPSRDRIANKRMWKNHADGLSRGVGTPPAENLQLSCCHPVSHHRETSATLLIDEAEHVVKSDNSD